MDASLLARLNAALTGRYTLERELGRGGMATVWLARDLKHDRPVALKVLRPELAAALGPERFLREVRITARFNHPHILPLLDSGDADGFLYYVMPYVAGESLRDRLEREKQLPLDDALQIAREMADALSYAHSHDVVHRDVKPENILLESGHAVVADFGIARAITEAGGEKLTETGIAVGTPPYMSPEQGAGTKDLDGRSDLYSLGCVLYEMLAGRPPFVGPTVESVVHQHLAAEAPPVTSIRPAVPGPIAVAVSRALAKAPADRFHSVGLFAQALGDRATAVDRGSPDRRRRRPAWVVTVATTCLVSLAAVAVALLRARGGGDTLDPRTIAVLPFRVVGSEGARWAWLGDGMVDLLSIKFNGEGGLRAVDAAPTLRAWARATRDGEPLSLEVARRLAARMNAGVVLTGTAFGVPGRLQLSATLVDVRSGRAEASGEVADVPDSLASLLDRLTAELLTRRAGEAARLATLTTTSLPAIRAYLDGQAANRAARYEDAIVAFSRALELDSTFALAAMGRYVSEYWAGGKLEGVVDLAWRHRVRLNTRDRAVLEAMAGPRFPQPTPFPELIAARERAVMLSPDNPDAWFLLGDLLWHWGPAFEVPSWRERAVTALQRSVQHDSNYAGALHHLVEQAAYDGDTAEVRHWLGLYSPATSWYVRWRAAVALGDRAALDTLWTRVPGVPASELFVVFGEAIRHGVALEDLDRIARAMRARASAPADRVATVSLLWDAASNRGRPGEALQFGREWVSMLGAVPGYERRLVMDALYGDGDTAAAAAAAGELARRVSRSPAPGARDEATWAWDLCALTLWSLSRTNPAQSRAAALALRSRAVWRDTVAWVPSAAVCAALIDADLARTEGPSALAREAGRLDAVIARSSETDPSAAYGLPLALFPEHLSLARAHEAAGELVRALAAVRRRSQGQSCCLRYFSTFLEEEGRLAVLAGDTVGAIRAYRHYLALRSAPEPSVRPEVDSIRAAVTRLAGGRGPN